MKYIDVPITATNIYQKHVIVAVDDNANLQEESAKIAKQISDGQPLQVGYVQNVSEDFKCDLDQVRFVDKMYYYRVQYFFDSTRNGMVYITSLENIDNYKDLITFMNTLVLRRELDAQYHNHVVEITSVTEEEYMKIYKALNERTDVEVEPNPEEASEQKEEVPEREPEKKEPAIGKWETVGGKKSKKK